MPNVLDLDPYTIVRRESNVVESKANIVTKAIINNVRVEVHIAKHRRDGIFKFLSYLPVLYTKIIKRR